MGFDVRASANNLELWHVQLAGGVVRTMTLDELDSAFQADAIDERTMVMKAGDLSWTTLGDLLGLDANVDGQPNSIAPMATDIGSSALAMPRHDAPNFDFSPGTEELAVFRPKRRWGRVVVAAAVIGGLAGGLSTAKSYGTDKIRSKVAMVTSLVKGKGAEGARAVAVAPPPQAPIAPPVVNDAPPMANAKSVAIDSLPAAAPAPTPADKNDKNGKKKAEPTKKAAKGAASKKAAAAKSSDPTQKGSGQFDPLNGNL